MWCPAVRLSSTAVDVRDEPRPAVLFLAKLIVVPRLVVIDSALIDEVVEIS